MNDRLPKFGKPKETICDTCEHQGDVMFYDNQCYCKLKKMFVTNNKEHCQDLMDEKTKKFKEKNK